MAISYQQTDTAGDFAAAAFCSGLSSALIGTAPKKATPSGTPGSTDLSATFLTGATNQRAVYMQVVPDAGTTWAAGTWTVRLNTTIAATAADIQWASTFICRIDSGGTSQETLGSTTGQTTSVGSTGVHTMNVTGSATTPNAGDTIYIVLGFTNTRGSTNSFGIRHSELIDSPFTLVTAGMVYGSEVTPFARWL